MRGAKLSSSLKPRGYSSVRNLRTLQRVDRRVLRYLAMTLSDVRTLVAHGIAANPAEASEDSAELRRLHEAMDHAVATAYGWENLELEPIPFK
jgi:hypothetical protein